MLRLLKVMALTAIAACTYGVLHDQATIRVCPEYFTIAHAPLFPTSSPTLLALAWGIAATLPIGLVFGFALDRVTAGADATPLSLLARRIARLLAQMAAAAIVAALAGFALVRGGLLHLPESFAQMLPPKQDARFMAAWCAHGASYAVGLVGGLLLCVRLWRERGGGAVFAIWPKSTAASVRAMAVLLAGTLVIWWRFVRH